MGLRSLFHVRRAVTSLLKRVCHHPCSNFGFELFFSHASPAMPCPIFGHDASRFSPSRGHASDRNRPKLGWMKPKKRPYFSVIAPPHSTSQTTSLNRPKNRSSDTLQTAIIAPRAQFTSDASRATKCLRSAADRTSRTSGCFAFPKPHLTAFGNFPTSLTFDWLRRSCPAPGDRSKSSIPSDSR